MIKISASVDGLDAEFEIPERGDGEVYLKRQDILLPLRLSTSAHHIKVYEFSTWVGGFSTHEIHIDQDKKSWTIFRMTLKELSTGEIP